MRNLVGQPVYSTDYLKTGSKTDHVINVSQLDAGIYMLLVSSGTTQLALKVIICR
jgi:hypothetical protein